MSEKVSVVIPCYNNEKYIEVAIYSCLNQKYDNLQVIIIDDHSEDRSFEIANKFANQYDYIKCFKNRGKGANAARNYGVEMASGKYIQFLDCDDYLFAEDLIVKHIGKSKEIAEDVILFCDTVSIKDDDCENVLYHSKYARYKYPDIRDLLIDCIIQTSQLFIPKHIFAELGGLDENLIKAQEHDFNVRAASKDVRIEHNPIFGVVIRSHSSIHRISNQLPEKTKRNDFKVAEKFKTYIYDYLTRNDNYTITKLGNEVIKYLIFRGQQFGNVKDFETVKVYERKVKELKKEFGVKSISNYKSSYYSILLNILGFYYFELLRVNILSRVR